MRIVSYFLLLLCTTIVARAQYTLDTLRHLNIVPGGGYSAIWGYTAPDGREYAILGCIGSSGRPPGTSIIDITDNSNVQQVAFISGPASTWREMKTYLHYAYVVTEAGGGTQIIDLSELPDTARLVRSFTYTQGSKSTSSSHTITITDGFMYLNGCAGWGSRDQRGIVMFDLRNDPTNPQFVGEYSPAYVHDCYVLRDTVYAAAIYDTASGGGVWIADLTNKSNPQTIGRIRYAGSGTHNVWVTKDRRYAITTDEIGSINPKQLQFWDIGNLPTIPTIRTAAFSVNPGITVHNVTVRGDFAYSVWYSGRGIQIVDITNPTLPTLAAGYNTSTSALAWGIYPYFPSGKIIMGDGNNGLWVFSFSGLQPRVPVSLLEPGNGDTVGTQSPLTFRWTKSADVNKDPHYYEVRLTGPGVDTTWRSNDSITTFSNVGAMQEGQTYSWYVVTRDEWNTTMSPDTAEFVVEGGTGVASITVLSPNGGESWQYNTSHNITWTANLVDTVNISFKTSPTSMWTSVAEDIPALAGLYAWTLPNVPTSQARVRVVDKLNGAVLDSSNGFFNITVPAISVVPASLDFGNVNTGSTKKDTLRIHNTGTASLTVSSITIDSAGFSVSRTSLNIAAGSSDTITVAFSPTQVRSYLATMTLSSDAPTTPTTVALSGAGQPPSSVGENELPTDFALRQNYPNPFNPSTVISFDIPATVLVSLRVYNLIGQQVAELVNGTREPGRYRISFETTNLASGVYFYRLHAGSFTDTKRMMLVR
ncbi:MAG: choice-of-anchor B family protein [Ignavibacteriae bacterium]|nr:choice-of-anchor B family protein [Ignavibacteriota bacterium]